MQNTSTNAGPPVGAEGVKKEGRNGEIQSSVDDRQCLGQPMTSIAGAALSGHSDEARM